MAHRETRKISVVMSAYNAQDYIRDAVESVLSQDCDDFELLILDACSKDKTWSLMRQYRNLKNVRLFRSKLNISYGEASNRLIGACWGKYISTCDADDIMLQHNLGRLSTFLDGNPAYGAVYADMLALELNLDNLAISPPYLLKIDKSLKWDILQNLINHGGSMIRKNCFTAVGGYDKRFRSLDDWDLWIKLAEITKIKHLRGEIYYVWRRHSKSASQIGRGLQRDYREMVTAAIKRRYGINLALK